MNDYGPYPHEHYLYKGSYTPSTSSLATISRNIETGFFAVMAKNLTLTSTSRFTVAGTGRLVII